jgi:hypothetical protein
VVAKYESVATRQVFQRRTWAIATDVAGTTVRALNMVDPETMQQGFANWMVVASRTITAGQRAAQTQAAAYFRSVSRLEMGQVPGDSTPDPDDTIEFGYTPDGRTLQQALSAIPAKVFAALASGRSVPEAMLFARYAARRTATTSVMDSARYELTARVDASAAVVGWRWKSSGTCDVCMSLDTGQVEGGGLLFQAHPNCQCVPEPVFKKERRSVGATGMDHFRRMAKAAQDALFGPDVADGLRDGTIQWADIPRERHSHRWRNMIVARSAVEILDRAKEREQAS